MSGEKILSLLACLTFVCALTLGAVPSSAKTIELKYGHVVPEFHAVHKGAVATKEYVERESGGAITIQIFPMSQLGGERTLAEQVQAGNLEMTNVGTPVMSNFVPQLNVYNLPFVFPNRDVCIATLKSKTVRDRFFPLLPPKGFIPLGFGSAEPRDLTNKLRSIRSPEDLKGLKIRVMESAILIDIFKTLGANPITMPFGEVYSGLQQGVVDAQDNPVDISNMMKFTEVTKYATYLGHIIQCQLVSVSAMIWDRLSDEHKNIIRKGVAVGEKVAWDIGTESIANGERVAIEKYGVSITHLTPAEHKAFRRAVSSVHEKYRKIIGPKYYDFFVNEVEKLSK